MESPAPTAAPVTVVSARTARSSMLTVGVPAVLAIAAMGGATFLLGGSGDDAIRTGDAVTTSMTSTTTSTVAQVFTSAGVSVERSTPAPTATSTTATAPVPTTAAPTTVAPSTIAPSTVAPTSTIPATLPEQPPEPVAPPADPRGPEDQTRLGGIAIPKLGVDAPLLEGIRLTTLDNGPGHWPGTAMPGEVGNVVVAAHRTSHGGPFRNIDQLVAGDTVVFTTDAGEVDYTVTGTQIVEPDAIWIIDPTDTPTATLFACHPPGSVAQRIVVNLELAS